MQGGAFAPRLNPATGRINVKVYERLERNGTTAKWDRDGQKWELKRKRNSGFKVGWDGMCRSTVIEHCGKTLDSRLDMKGEGIN
jgi:hypothetical protein